MRVFVLATLDSSNVATGFSDYSAASSCASSPRLGIARAIFKVAISQCARHRWWLPAYPRATTTLLPILQVPRRSTRTLLSVNSTVTILNPASNVPQFTRPNSLETFNKYHFNRHSGYHIISSLNSSDLGSILSLCQHNSCRDLRSPAVPVD